MMNTKAYKKMLTPPVIPTPILTTPNSNCNRSLIQNHIKRRAKNEFYLLERIHVYKYNPSHVTASKHNIVINEIH